MLVDADRIVMEPVVPVPGHQTEARFPLARGPFGPEAAPAACGAPLPPELAAFVATACRNHRHLGNVLTHVSGGNWKRVEEALRAILEPRADCSSLTPLACNIVDLMCADRGVTGRILKPYYQGLLIGALGEDVAGRVIDDVMALFAELEANARRLARTCPIAASQSSGKIS